jgi:hypothetical protein
MRANRGVATYVMLAVSASPLSGSTLAGEIGF